MFSRTILIALSFCGMLLLVACGSTPVDETVPTLASGVLDDDSETGTTDESVAAGDASESGFTATLSGAADAQIDNPGQYICFDDSLRTQINIMSGTGGPPSVTISLPVDAQPGEYDLAGADNISFDDLESGQAHIDVTSAAGDFWTSGSGSMTLESLPDAPGERATGSFSAELTSEDVEGILTISGDFDIAADNFISLQDQLCTSEGRATATAERNAELEAEQAADEAADEYAQTVELPAVPDDLNGMQVTIRDGEGNATVDSIVMEPIAVNCAATAASLEADPLNAEPYGIQWIYNGDVDGLLRLQLITPLDIEPGRYAPELQLEDDASGVIVLSPQFAVGEGAGMSMLWNQAAVRIDQLPQATGDTLTGALTATGFSGNEDAVFEAVFNIEVTDDNVFRLQATDAGFCTG
jgi:hypothetical protein